MKKQTVFILFALLAGIYSYGQCDKKNILHGGGFENLDASGVVQSKDEREIKVVYDSKMIQFSPGDVTLDGTVDAITCNWTVPFKEGKTFIKTTLTRTDGSAISGTITIEGKEGKNILTMEFEGSDYPTQRLTLTKFEETN
ncbi:MAG: hypothetical protein JNM14_00735 [Ferruginibacter sp.]|nr:hypothetical protein [Ferruginibacter sp.]